MERLIFIAPALAMCLAIASIHVYLGMHVLEREIIFVDLSLAQLAALGGTVAALWQDEGAEVDAATYVVAFAFTAVGSAIFAFTRRARRHLSMEAVVGIVYAVASAATILVVSRSPHGAEHIKDILVRDLLATSWSQVAGVLAAYVVLGAIQLALARRFVMISWRPDEAERTMPRVELWDLAFFLLFGVVITISVRYAGILLVFSYLIVPAVVTRLFSQSILGRLFWGWGVAVAGSLAGAWASSAWDLPTGAAIVVSFGILLAGAGAVRAVRRPAPA